MTKLHLEIKDYWSPDIDNVWDWCPDDPENVYFIFQFDVGVSGEAGANNFQTIVCTSKGCSRYLVGAGLNKNTAKMKVTLLEDYSWPEFMRKLNEKVKSCERTSWEESVSELSNLFYWEYEGYIVDEDIDLNDDVS